MADQLMFVQFPHPGTEHRPSVQVGETMEWNSVGHRRKFLRSPGRFVRDGATEEAVLTFWGEWEPPARLVREFDHQCRDGPRWLYEPLLDTPARGGLLQNTDPMVFGPQFLYSNCRQSRNRKLRELASGSVILFGSQLSGEFVLDTVFVVGDSTEYTVEKATSLAAEPFVRMTVLERIQASDLHPRESLRLYRGRTHSDAPDGPFSFVPALPDGQRHDGFARPGIDLDRRRIQPNLAMAAKATPATEGELGELWIKVREDVEAAGLVLGLQFETPRQTRGSRLPSSLVLRPSSPAS